MTFAIERCATGRLRYAYPAGEHDVEFRLPDGADTEMLRRVGFSMPRRIRVASADGQSAAWMRSAAVARAATIPCTPSGS